MSHQINQLTEKRSELLANVLANLLLLLHIKADVRIAAGMPVEVVRVWKQGEALEVQ